MSSSLPRAGAPRWAAVIAAWRRSPAAISWYVVVDTAAVVITIWGLATLHASRHDLLVATALVVLGVAQSELSRRIERTRSTVNLTRHVDLTSVWTFAGVLVLPPGLTYVLIWLLYLHLTLRSWVGSSALSRRLLAPSAVVVTAPLAHQLFHWISPHPFVEITAMSTQVMVATLVSAVAFSLIDVLIIAIAVWARAGRDAFLTYIADFGNQSLDLSTNFIGVFIALALVYQPLFVLFALVPVLVLQRSVLVKELEDRASRDQKTQLLNATAWNEYATTEIERAGRQQSTVAVLVLDLDHFKRINDSYGHLAGDDVLVGVADVLRSETRRYDSAGRFGGEEFVVLLPGADRSAAMRVAERTRRLIADLRVRMADGTVIGELTTSVGVAMFPTDGHSLPDLLASADRALYLAKDRGRNRVVSAEEV